MEILANCKVRGAFSKPIGAREERNGPPSIKACFMHIMQILLKDYKMCTYVKLVF